eukprot:TRINITY_DN51812_c0_g1_i1.p1 TRINITY_DN51812_c0_g1~~TRINITY_DN51812_c0_g1_i1.p1  ORF type:complete len:673 (+),score=86.39 TRINITY_DN51812_c0_g1_i1:290-2020(+)
MKLEIQNTIMFSADKNIPTRNGLSNGVGEQEFDNCFKRDRCAMMSSRLALMVQCTAVKCVPDTASVDFSLYEPTGVHTIIESIVGRDMGAPFRKICDFSFGKVGPVRIQGSFDATSPTSNTFSMRGAMVPPGGLPPIMARFDVAPAKLDMKADVVMGKQCIGFEASGGCNGMLIEGTALGRQVWEDVKNSIAEVLPKYELPSGLTRADQAGPAMSMRLGMKGFSLKGEAKGKIAAAAIPGLEAILPAANVKFELSHKGVYLDADVKLALGVTMRHIVDIDFTKPKVNLVDLSIDLSPLHRLKDDLFACAKSKIPGFEVIEFIFNAVMIIQPVSFRMIWKGWGLDVTFKIKLVGQDVNIKLAFNAKDFVNFFKGIFGSGRRLDSDRRLNACRNVEKVMSTVTDKLKKLASIGPCDCQGTCGPIVKPGARPCVSCKRWDHWCPKSGWKWTYGKHFIHCGIGWGRHPDKCHYTTFHTPHWHWSRRRWAGKNHWHAHRTRICIPGLPYSYTKSCWYQYLDFWSETCTTWLPGIDYSSFARRRECKSVGKLLGLPAWCLTGLALDKAGLWGVPGLEKQVHC